MLIRPDGYGRCRQRGGKAAPTASGLAQKIT
jgi:hypothetical protein